MSTIVIGAVLGCLVGIAGGFLGTVIGAYFSPMCQIVMSNRFQLAWLFGDTGIRLGAILGVICGGGAAATIDVNAPAIVIGSAGVLFGVCAWVLVRDMDEHPVGFVIGAIGGGVGGGHRRVLEPLGLLNTALERR